MRRATWALGLCWVFLSCGGDGASSGDGGRDAPQVLSENTAAMCGDGRDNDGDGKTDCADQDCWPLTFCAEARPDGWQPLADASAADSFYDAPYPGDGNSTLDSSLVSCAIHWDCPQGEFCYKGKCLRDKKQAVLHCGKPGCPPGHWCLTQANVKDRCPEDPAYVCVDACDCGPAHCCKQDSQGIGRCVKHAGDPWLPGPGSGVGPTGLSCSQGDATYCCGDPTCHAGILAYGSVASLFRCHADSGPRGFCGGGTCFGTACRCGPGESCVDTVTPGAPAGQTCGLLSGGTCVNNATAEAVFGWAPSELLPCCDTGCTGPGQICDRGWRSGGRFAYARAKSVCGTCGNGVCDPPEETSETCEEDCAQPVAAVCGDGSCDASASETPSTCPSDCGSVCPDAAVYPAIYRVCGDGICGDPTRKPTTCYWGESETCKSCPQDCGRCDWIKVRGTVATGLTAIWGSAASDVFAVGSNGVILHSDGNSWAPMHSGTTVGLKGVWGSGPTDVFAVGNGGLILHHDGSSWKQSHSGPGDHFLYGVWGSSSTDVIAVGYGRPTTYLLETSGYVLRYDGGGWKSTGYGAGPALKAVWGSSSTNVFAVGYRGSIMRYAGTSWLPMTSGTTVWLNGVWGSGPSDVFAVGNGGTVLHYDGAVWSSMVSGTSEHLVAVWGDGSGEVFAAGNAGEIVRYSGGKWRPMSSASDSSFGGIWGSSKANVLAASDDGSIHRFDGSGWKPMFDHTREVMWSVWVGSNTAFAVGPRRVILRYDGSSWQEVDSGLSGGLLGVWAAGPQEAYAVGGEGSSYDDISSVILRFDGQTWQRAAGTPKVSLYSVWGSGPSSVWAVGNEGTILRYDGSKWSPETTPAISPYLRDIWGSGPSDIYVVGSEGPILHYGGSGWKAITAAPWGYFYGVWGSGPNDVFVVGSSPILHYDGSTWTPTTPSTAGSLRAVWGDGPTHVFAVSDGPGLAGPLPEGGTILHYDGKAWQPSPADFREEGTLLCRGLNDVGGAGGEFFIVGSYGLIARYCPAGVCP